MARPKKAEGEIGIVGTIRLTAARWLKLRRLGMAWLSKMIDRAWAARERKLKKEAKRA